MAHSLRAIKTWNIRSQSMRLLFPLLFVLICISCKEKTCNDHHAVIVSDYIGTVTQCSQSAEVEATLTDMEYIPSGISFRLKADSIAVDTFYVFELTCDPETDDNLGLLLGGVDDDVIGQFNPTSNRITLNLMLPGCTQESYLDVYKQ